jgi:hypothetical protein
MYKHDYFIFKVIWNNLKWLVILGQSSYPGIKCRKETGYEKVILVMYLKHSIIT